MGIGNHNTNCATAAGHKCRCTGCGGSQHGLGWIDVARGPIDVRKERRTKYEDALRVDPRSGLLRQNAKNRARVTDLARLDIADWLASRQSGVATRGDPDGANGADGASAATPEAIDHVTALAEAITKASWEEIAEELDHQPAARDVRRDLANHGWCDLLVGMIRAVETCKGALNLIPETSKKIVKAMMLESSRQGARAHATAAVVSVVVDKVWQAFKAALFVKVPLLSITSDETLRALRVLAVFVCPAPEDHKEVRKYALEPLGDEIKGILTDETKKRLGELFNDWMKDGRPAAQSE